MFSEREKEEKRQLLLLEVLEISLNIPVTSYPLASRR